ncbi:hypothetical protein J437_LFUL014209, partial [Ladona fulva]
MEIYKERVRDLLQPDDVLCSSFHGTAQPFILRVREHPRHGPYHVVEDSSSLSALVTRGEIARRTACTPGNPRSSRGHAILAISPLSKHTHHSNHYHPDAQWQQSPRLHLVDLAGSERAGAAGEPSDDCNTRLKEGASINRSLVTLGNVISALAERCSSRQPEDQQSRSSSESPSRSSPSSSASSTPSHCSPTTRRRRPITRQRTVSFFFVPYRDSVLTWLLKDSLGGNSKTVMIAAISPSSTCYNETISTLRYAQRTKCIVNSPVINEDPNARIIRELRAEVERLRGMLLSMQMVREPDGVMASPKEAEDGEPLERSVEGCKGSAEGHNEEEVPTPFFLQQDCQPKEDGIDEQHKQCAEDIVRDGPPQYSADVRPPAAARCAVMGREDSLASETTPEDDVASTPPLGSVTGDIPFSSEEPFEAPAEPKAPKTQSALNRSYGSCELVYSGRSAEPTAPSRTRNRSLSSGGIWNLRRQSSVEAQSSPTRPTQEDRSHSSSSLDSLRSTDSTRIKGRGGGEAGRGRGAESGVRGRGRQILVRTGVAEARRRAAEQARRRAE